MFPGEGGYFTCGCGRRRRWVVWHHFISRMFTQASHGSIIYKLVTTNGIASTEGQWALLGKRGLSSGPPAGTGWGVMARRV